MSRAMTIAIITAIVGAIVAFVLNLILKRKEKDMTQLKDDDIAVALKYIEDNYGKAIAANVERIYRLETANFSSGQFKKTFGAGTEVGRDSKGTPIMTFPYGWNSVLWNAKKEFAPIGIHTMKENIRKNGQTIKGGGPEKNFLIFPSLIAAMTHLADYLGRYGNDVLRWYGGTDDKRRAEYAGYLKDVKNTYIV